MHPVDKLPFLGILNEDSKKALLIDSARIRVACLESECIDSLRSDGSTLFEDPDKVTVNLPMFNEKFTQESCVNNTPVCMVYVSSAQD